jgi:two-component system chemotaxis response regulator CheY
MKSALIVDGEPSIGGILEEVLKSEGMETVTMAHGSEAADYARAQKFDVVFVDSSSPLSDGIELTRKIRRSGYNYRTPIVMITTPKYTGFLTEGFEAGASFMIYKPIDRTRLQRLVRLMQGVIENEIRRFRRVVVEVKALIQSGGEEVQAATVDLSLNGALVRAERIFPRGSTVKINLYVAPLQPVVGHGLVMRTVNDNQMGIQFDGLSFNESTRLQDFLLPLVAA